MTDQSHRPDGDGLQACPFCARDVDLINGNGNPEAAPRWLVVCEACGSFHFDENETEEAVQIQWNSRAPQPTRDGAEGWDDLNPVRSTLRLLEKELRDFAKALGKGDDLGVLLTRSADSAKFALSRRDAFSAPPKPAPDAVREAAQRDVCRPATDWVDCPICGESDMRCDRDEDGQTIHCTNLNCLSNGGTNAAALAAPVPPADGTERRWLNDLIKAAEAFRIAMVVSGALNKIGQDSYVHQLRALESALNPFNYRSSGTGAAENSAPAAVRESACSTPRSPASAAMGLSAGVEAGAAEPVGWRWRIKDSQGAASGWCFAAFCPNIGSEILHDCEPLYAAHPVRGDREAVADDIRAHGWTVAVHNDYRQGGEAHTFWLFTNRRENAKGEGKSDAEALNQVRTLLSLPVLPGAGERTQKS